MSKGNKMLRLRLPEGHWVWQIDDSFKRSEEVKKALDFYQHFGEDFKALKEAVCSVINLNKTDKDNNEEEHCDSIVDRVFSEMDKFFV